MPFISVTRLRIRSIRFMPAFVLLTLRSRSQVRQANGFRTGSLLADRKWTFWTMTAWDSQESMRRYISAGAHHIAMPRLLEWCDEASLVHWTQLEEALPSWVEADRRMRAAGRPSKVRNPSAEHARLGYPTPRVTEAAPIGPLPPSN